MEIVNLNLFDGKKVLVTGGHGFKGTWLCLALQSLGATVLSYGLISNSSILLHSIIRSQVTSIEFVEGDINSFDLLSQTVLRFSPEIVYHLAAEPLVSTGYEIPSTVFQTNTLGTVNLLEACRLCKSVKSIVNITTDKVYSNPESNVVLTEDYALGGDDPYSASKACSELITNSYYRSFFKPNSVGVATARAGNVIGPGDFSVNRLLPDIIKSSASNSPLYIRSPLSVRPWQHVLHSISGYLLLGSKLYSSPEKFSKPFNFGPSTSQILTVQDIIDSIKALNVLDFNVIYRPADFLEKSFLMLDSSLAKSELGWDNSSDINQDLFSIISGYKLILESPEDVLEYCKSEIMQRITSFSYA